MWRASMSRCGVATRPSIDQVAPQFGQRLQVVGRGLGEDLLVEPFEPVFEVLEQREEGVGEGVEDAVDDELLGARRLRVEPLAHFVERRAGAVVDGDQVAAADEGVDLFQLDPLAARRPGFRRRVRGGGSPPSGATAP